MDTTPITHPEAQRFIQQFLVHRKINREFYSRLTEVQLDFRMVNNPDKKSDSPRESIAHQIQVEDDYIQGIISGILIFHQVDYKNTSELAKQDLLNKMDERDSILIRELAHPEIGKKLVKVPWSLQPLPAIASIWGLQSHEILHTGWNLALMDHLNIERFSELKQQWG